ncbi:unnamed protein product [Adineta steineri]|uniref:F-box domain-containing protein n=1 Tax=Adineta steineri TaxID=433720 RepID=A0A815PJG2_9BILA|nr:unnamed protein product [Adineta steineri]CAF1343459.1 unnamed protein product [Adineta steineri]CAF1449749.1 unnamed protein product [Adineta steineri]
MVTTFEHLPNELILRCFSYFNFFELYDLFYDLNRRFHHLIRYESKLYIDLDAVSDAKRLTFYLNLNQIIATNQNYQLSIITENEHDLRILFYDNLFQDKLCNLKSLILSNVPVETIYSIIFETTAKLYEGLRHLKLLDGIKTKDKESEHDKIQKLCNNLISSKMKSLIYLHINFDPYEYHDDTPSPLDDIYLEFEELSKRGESLSQLETLIIGELCDDNDHIMSAPTIRFCSLITNLLPCVPRLETLFINSIHFMPYYNDLTKIERTTHLMIPSNLRKVTIWIDRFDGDNIEKNINIVRQFFINNNLLKMTSIKIFSIPYEEDF